MDTYLRLDRKIDPCSALQSLVLIVFFPFPYFYNWSVSGGFATMNPDSSLNINAIEAFPVEEFSAEAVRNGLAEAQRLVNSGATEEEKIAAKIEVEVFEALQAAINAK